MLVYFDDGKDFNKDLEELVKPLEKFNKPLVVLPTDKDVRTAEKKYENVTFITYDYWLSKKWIADGDYDHIDFFRVDQFLMSRSYGVKTGAASVRRTIGKKVEKEKEEA